MKREQRLQIAKQWLLKYEGKYIVKGYRKHFGVDIMCAITELQMLGYEISQEYIENVKKTIEAEQIKRKENKEQQMFDRFSDSDDTFYIYSRIYLWWCTLWCNMGKNGA